MASFDVIEAAGFGYRLAWTERRYLMRLAAFPFLIKFVCHITVIALGWQTDFIRQALISLPAYFAEGWLYAHLVRLVFLEQRWPFKFSGNQEKDMASLQDRAQGVLGGMLFYVLIRFLLAGLIAIVYAQGYGPTEDMGHTPPSAHMSPTDLIVTTTILLSIIWAFRFLWLHIPAAVGYPIRKFIIKLGSYKASLAMVGTWLVCFMPVFFFFNVLISVIFPLFGQEDSARLQLDFTINFLSDLLDIMSGIIATAGIAYGIRIRLSEKQKQA